MAWLVAGAGCSAPSQTQGTPDSGVASVLPEKSARSNEPAALNTASTSSAVSNELVITDDLGREVRLEKPQRVAVLIGSFADAYAAAGGESQIVAAAHDSWTSFDLELDGAADLGDVKSIAQETLLASEPDLVIASAKNESQKKMKEMLEAAQIPVVYFDVSSFEDYLSVLERMSQMTGDQQAYEKNGAALQKEIEAIRQRPHAPLKVLALRETGKGITALGSSNSVLGEMLEDLGCENIAGAGGLQTLSAEEIHVQNPDVILYVAQGKDLPTARSMAESLFGQDAWASLDAVKDKKVFVLDQRLYNLKPNARWAAALKDLETLLYGD